MRFKIDDSKKFLVLISSTQLEFEQISASLTKRKDNWFIIKKKSLWAKTEEKFIDQYSRVPCGLWREIQKLAKKYKFPLEIEGIEYLYNKDFDESEFIEWANTYFENSEKKPRDYQIEAAVRILKYRNCVEEVATSGGKTFIAFMIFKYLLNKKIINKMLYVVPHIDLVNQTEEEFYSYEDDCGFKPNWKSECIFGGSKKEKENINIVFGTYQSLVKKDLDYFKNFDVVCIDECLHPDTLITMFDGSKKKIKDIKIGEKVLTKNEKTKKIEIKEIEFVYKNLSINQQMYQIEMENGNILNITGNHNVLTINNILKKVDELSIDDEIVQIDE